MTPSQFGYFALVFTLLQSLGALQLALVTRPHNVLGSRLAGEAYRRFTTTAAVWQVALAGTAALLLALGAGLARLAGGGSTGVFLLAVPTLFAWQLQEFGRRVLYTEGRLGGALANDALSYGGQAVLLVALFAAGRLDGQAALAVVAATSAVAACVAALQLRAGLGRAADGGSFSELWRFGKWLGAAEVSYWFSSQYYVYLAAALVGPVASGALKAGQTVLGPVSVFLAFFVNYLPIRFVRRGIEDETERRRQLRLGLTATVPPVLAYGLLVALFARPLLKAVYGAPYEHDASVVRLFAAYYVLLSVSDVVVASLSARGLTRRVFAGHVGGAAVSLAAGWLLVLVYGPAGGVGGMLLALGAAFAVFVTGSGPAPVWRRRPAEE